MDELKRWKKEAVKAKSRVRVPPVEIVRLGTMLEKACDLIEGYESSFRLYDNAIRKGTEAWHLNGGDELVWPDTAKLVTWMVNTLEEQTTLIDHLTDNINQALGIFGDYDYQPNNLQEAQAMFQAMRQKAIWAENEMARMQKRICGLEARLRQGGTYQ